MSCNCKTVKNRETLKKKNILCNSVFHWVTDKKVQLNTDLFLDAQRYLYRKELSDKYWIKKETEFLIKWEASVADVPNLVKVAEEALRGWN